MEASPDPSTMEGLEASEQPTMEQSSDRSATEDPVDRSREERGAESADPEESRSPPTKKKKKVAVSSDAKVHGECLKRCISLSATVHEIMRTISHLLRGTP